MHRVNVILVTTIVAIGSMAMYGCTSSKPVASTTDQTSDVDHTGHDHDGEVAASDMEKMKQELAKLSETDRVAAEKQHMCPVSGEMLGSMGVPPKVSVKGRDVFICCAGCEEQLLNSPDTYLAKLKQ